MLLLAKAVGILLTPPGVVIVLAVLGLVLQMRRRSLGALVLWLSVVILFVMSMPITGNALLQGLEKSVAPLPRVDDIRSDGIEAIVVLGGGRAADQPQYGGDTVNRFALERLRYAARLQRATGLPILVSGGTVFGSRTPEAELMRQTLARDFQVSVDWVENRSRNTMENAVYSRAILEAAGKKRIWLVTDAWHMPRAYWAFRHAGIDAVMAPTGFTAELGGTLLDLLPTSNGIFWSGIALHERLGLMWYRLRYRAESTTEAGSAVIADK
jgi:uncharacterized SAM-binding protein YcdF (DUF218 family)